MTHYPAPLKRGSKIAITAFSSGVTAPFKPRFDIVTKQLEVAGFIPVFGDIVYHSGYGDYSVKQRADELMSFLLNDEIDAIMPPWGGQFAMDLLPLLDFEKLKHARPKWLIGFSDISTLQTTLTSKLGWASCHCLNLMQLVPKQQDDLSSKLFSYLAMPSGSAFTQQSSLRYEINGPNVIDSPDAPYNLTEQTAWLRVHNDEQVSGRLFGGCLDTLMHLLDSPFSNLKTLSSRYHEGVLLYLENAELSPESFKRALQGLQYRGVFDNINGLLLGRNPPASGSYNYHMAINEVFAQCQFPVFYDLDIGHFPPNLTLINGSFAQLDYAARTITQTLN